MLGTVAASAALTISEIPFQGPIGAVRVGRIDGEFVVNPTYSELAESELDLVVSGTRDAIMMVEAGAKLLPEDVMAEAILFGHRAAPAAHRPSSTSCRAASARPKVMPFLEAGVGSVLDFIEGRRAAEREFVVVDVETTGTDPKMADLVEIGAVKDQGRQDRRHAGRPSSNPGRPILGNQMHGITDARRQEGAPKPAEAAKQAFAFIGDAILVGHIVGFDLGFLEAALGDGTHFEPGTLPRHAGDRPRGLSGPRELQARRPCSLLRDRALARPIGPLPDAEATAQAARHLVRRRPARPDRGAARGRSRPRSGPTGPAATRKALLEAARREARVSKGLFSLVHKKTVRELGSRRGDPDGRPRPRPSSARSRSRSGSCPGPTAPGCSPGARPRP